MKKLILIFVMGAGLTFMVTSCATDKCPALNGGYMELKMPKATKAPQNVAAVSVKNSHEKYN